MHVLLNGEPVETAPNEDFVPRLRRAQATLADGDKVEVFSPRQGG